MSTNWSVLFFETLTGYVQKYIEAYGDTAARAKILKDCWEDITKSPLHDEQDVQLPQHLSCAIRRQFLPYLDDDNSEEEDAKLVQLENGGEDLTGLTPEEREVVARPPYASDYWDAWDGFHAAQRIFRDEVALIDEGCRDKKDKKSLGKRTAAIRQWFGELPTSKLDEAKKAAEKWNSEGTPNKERMEVYRKKNLCKETVKFTESICRAMGVHCVVLHAYKTLDGEKTTTLYMETDTWAVQGAELLGDYMAGDVEGPEKSLSDTEEEEVPEVMVDASRHPILPLCPKHLRSQQDVIRDIFMKSYRRMAMRNKVHVPWLELARTPTKYLDVNTLPEGFDVLDPSRLTKTMILRLWDHWSYRSQAQQPILVFINGREQDLDLDAIHVANMREYSEKRLLDESEVWPDYRADDNEVDRAHKSDSEGISGSSNKPPPSKRPRLSVQPATPDELSPAAHANNRDRRDFLYSLDHDPSYKSLLDRVLALPAFACPQSSSLVPKSKLSLPVWASWDWGQKYLPNDIHTRLDEFNKALDLLQKYTFADLDKGTSVVLGFGLLLHKCWRAVEAEDDDETTKLLQESVLGMKMVRQAIKAIDEVIGRFPSPNTGEERPKEKEMDGDAQGQKAKVGQKTCTTSKRIARPCTPPPVASTSKKPPGT